MKKTVDVVEVAAGGAVGAWACASLVVAEMTAVAAVPAIRPRRDTSHASEVFIVFSINLRGLVLARRSRVSRRDDARAVDD
jgi:hypothetical protein